jgi:hypothetical protein
MIKFIDESVNDIESGNTNAPWIYSRFADILLNYAEAMYNLGQKNVYHQHIKMVRSRTGVEMPPGVQIDEDIRERLVNERRIELVFEEHYCLSPISLTVNEKNPPFKQNPNYNEKNPPFKQNPNYN